MACPALPANGFSSVAAVLRSVDCQADAAVQSGFARLFGESGTLSQALTLVLTLYVGFLAVNMLTGRSRLSVSMITPRMWQLGLVLTLATSWVAYQSVAWTLLARAPDQLASLLVGTQGSATAIFAERLDSLFAVLSQSAQIAQGANAVAPTPGAIMPQLGGMSAKPADLLWLASLLLLLGTVGVLVVARIALAAVMALGPVFVVLALFQGTRGLFEGWLKTAVALAIAPVFAVLLGGATLGAIAPMIQSLAQSGGKVPLGLATSIFLAAFVYLALMVMAMRAARQLTSGWQLPRNQEDQAAGWSQFWSAQNMAQQTDARATGESVSMERATPADPRLREIIGAASAVSAQSLAAPWEPPASAGAAGYASTQIGNFGSGRDPRLRPISLAARAAGKEMQ